MTEETPVHPKSSEMYGVLGFEQDNLGDEGETTISQVRAVLAGPDREPESFDLVEDDRVDADPSDGGAVEEIGLVYSGDVYGGIDLGVKCVYYSPDSGEWWIEPAGMIDDLDTF